MHEFAAVPVPEDDLRLDEPLGHDALEDDLGAGLHVDLGVAFDLDGRDWKREGKCIQLF